MPPPLYRKGDVEAETFSKPRFLSKWDEWFFFAVPSAGLLVGTVYWVANSFGRPLEWHQNLALWFLSFVFLDSVHVIYTFVLLWTLPELRQWSRNASDASRSLISAFWTKVLLFALGAAILFYTLELTSLSDKIVWLGSLYAFLEAFGPQQHTLAQMRGISFCYNSAIRRAYTLEPSELQQAVNAERWEKILFRCVLLGDMIFSTGFFLRSGNYAVPDFVPWFEVLGASIVTVAAGGILLNARRYPKQQGSGKLPYLSRILLFTLKNLAIPAALAVRATHGSEYLVVVKQMVKNSGVTEERKKRIFALFIGVTVIYFFVLFLGVERALVKDMLPPKWAPTLLSCAVLFHIVVRWVHYYVDAVVFRMKDPATRAIVAPLLVPAPQASESVVKTAA